MNKTPNFELLHLFRPNSSWWSFYYIKKTKLFGILLQICIFIVKFAPCVYVCVLLLSVAKNKKAEDRSTKELKLVHRNQTIITSSSSEYDAEVPFDFSNNSSLTIDRDRSVSIEPMELDMSSSSSLSMHRKDEKDVEMETIEMIDQRQITCTTVAVVSPPQPSTPPTITTSAIGIAAVRPTTLNIPGPDWVNLKHKIQIYRLPCLHHAHFLVSLLSLYGVFVSELMSFPFLFLTALDVLTIHIWWRQTIGNGFDGFSHTYTNNNMRKIEWINKGITACQMYEHFSIN